MLPHFNFCCYIIDLLQFKAAKIIALLFIITLSFPTYPGVAPFRCNLHSKYTSVVSNSAIVQLCVWTNKKVALVFYSCIFLWMFIKACIPLPFLAAPSLVCNSERFLGPVPISSIDRDPGAVFVPGPLPLYQSSEGCRLRTVFSHLFEGFYPLLSSPHVCHSVTLSQITWRQ